MNHLSWYVWALWAKDDPVEFEEFIKDPASYPEYMTIHTTIRDFEEKTLPNLIEQYGEGFGVIISYIEKHHNDPEVLRVVNAAESLFNHS